MNLLNLLYEIGTLKRIPRTGHRQGMLLNDDADNVSSHSHRVAAIAYFIAQKENADISKVLIMALFHDVPETRSGDQSWIHKNYVKVYEDEIMSDQFKDVDDELYRVINEYAKRESLESEIVKDADNLEEFLSIKEFIMQGNKEATTWLEEKNIEMLYTQTAKNLFKELMNSNPSSWCADLYTPERR